MVHLQGNIAPGIESDPHVCGGDPCIIRTRIPVWVLVQSRRLGMSEADILKSYPSLQAKDLENAWSYEHTHRGEIDRQIAENEEPNVLSQLAFHGIRHRMGLATSDELRQAANVALTAGIYSPAIADAAIFLEESIAEIGPVFDKALTELHIDIPESKDECCWSIARHYIHQIATKIMPPRKGLEELVRVYYGCNLNDRDAWYVGDYCDIHQLIGSFYGYDDLLERSKEVSYDGLYGEAAIAALDARVVAECVSWLERHPPGI